MVSGKNTPHQIEHIFCQKSMLYELPAVRIEPRSQFFIYFRFRNRNVSTSSSSSRPYQRDPLQTSNTNVSSRVPGFLGTAQNRSSASSGPRRGGAPKRNLSGRQKAPANRGSRNQNVASENTNSDKPNCNCGQPAVELIVRKEGPNTGRKFFKCSQSSGGCHFFVWADAPPNKRSYSTSAAPQQEYQ